MSTLVVNEGAVSGGTTLSEIVTLPSEVAYLVAFAINHALSPTFEPVALND